jgi:hypothetical protein
MRWSRSAYFEGDFRLTGNLPIAFDRSKEEVGLGESMELLRHPMGSLEKRVPLPLRACAYGPSPLPSTVCHIRSIVFLGHALQRIFIRRSYILCSVLAAEAGQAS